MSFSIRQTDIIERMGVSMGRAFLHASPSLKKLLENFFILRKAIRKYKPDIIHVHYGTTTGWLVTMSTKIPVVVTFHGSDLNPSPGQSWWKGAIGRFLSQWAAGNARAIICVSNELRKRLHFGKQRVTVIPMGYDSGLFFQGDKNIARGRLGWTHLDPVLLFNSGSNRKVKRGDLALAAYNVANKITPKLRFVQLSGELPISKIPDYMNASDVLIFTSDYEGSPTVIKEAMSCGLPIVSVDVGDINERLRNVSPSRITNRNPHNLGRAVCEILNIGGRSNGPDIAKAEVSDEVVAANVLKVLRAVSGTQ